MHITISIQDKNLFFVQGLECILYEYFSVQRNKISIDFISGESVFLSDLIILGDFDGGLVYPYLFQERNWYRGAVVIVDRETSARGWRTIPPFTNHLGILSRRASPKTVGQLIDRVVDIHCNSTLQVDSEKEVYRPNLTQRELEVLSVIATGLATGHVGSMLKINTKTVSSHKRAAMLKLGFRRNIELYHWLRLGGLEQIKRK